jgi:hypothetical protein
LLDMRAPGFIGPVATLIVPASDARSASMFTRLGPGALDIALPDRLLRDYTNTSIEI